MVPVALLIGIIGLTAFVFIELARARAGKPVVFDFGDLVHRGFRYGLINTTVLAMGEFGAFFVLPLFLQAGLHLSALETGRWLLPAGIMAFVGGGLGGRLSKRFGPKYVITVGLAFEATGIFIYVLAFSTSTTFWQLLPGLLLHGIGIGFATSQLTNVVLSDIPPQKAGSASGASGMVRQVGTALGIALIGAIFVSQAATNVRHDLNAVAGMTPEAREQIVASVTGGIGGGAPQVPTGVDGQAVGAVVSSAVAEASKPAVAFAGAVVVLGALLSLLVPNIPPDEHDQPAEAGAGEPPERERTEPDEPALA
jgi:MFS family permease